MIHSKVVNGHIGVLRAIAWKMSSVLTLAQEWKDEAMDFDVSKQNLGPYCAALKSACVNSCHAGPCPDCCAVPVLVPLHSASLSRIVSPAWEQTALLPMLRSRLQVMVQLSQSGLRLPILAGGILNMASQSCRELQNFKRGS